MPSWNIHIAHVERLLREEGAARLGITDVNEFLFGNLIPDVNVGYMVVDPQVRLDYKLTHLARKNAIPSPREDEYWEDFLVGRTERDMLSLGCWCHLVCDNVYNAHTRAYIERIGVPTGEQTRIRKQGDFALYGRTRDISLVPEATDGLVAAARDFVMFSICEKDVVAACDVAAGIVRQNREEHVVGEPEYSLLTTDFFREAADEAHDRMVAGLTALAGH